MNPEVAIICMTTVVVAVAMPLVLWVVMLARSRDESNARLSEAFREVVNQLMAASIDHRSSHALDIEKTLSEQRLAHLNNQERAVSHRTYKPAVMGEAEQRDTIAAMMPNGSPD